MAGVADLTAQYQKDFGDGVGGEGHVLPSPTRLPTGIFSFDLATGGGIPQAMITEIFGPESSGKSNLVYKILAASQKLYPDRKNALFDMEHVFDPDWARKMGINVESLYVFRPDYAEQVVDMVEGLLHADDCGVIALDSLAALTTARELGQSADKSDVGGSGLVIGKLIRKSVSAINAAEKEGRMPTLILVNQVRYKIGVMFGDPETTPGGNAPKFAAALRVRTFGKNIADPKISPVMPVAKKTTMVLKKWKVQITAPACEYEMAMVPHKGLNVGEVDDWNLVATYLRKYGKMDKGAKSGWVLNGEAYPTLVACKNAFYSDYAEAEAFKGEIIRKELEAVYGADFNQSDKDKGNAG